MPRKAEIESTKRKNRYREQVEELYTPEQVHKLGMEYIKGALNLKDLATKHGVALDHIYTMSRDGKWAEAKRDYRAKILKRASGRAAQVEADRLAMLMEASEQLDAALVRLATGETAIATAQDAQYMARALRDAVLAKRNLYNLPTIEEQARIDSAAGRLGIEKEKLELARKAQQADDTNGDVNVTFVNVDDDLSG